tara:strand:- start:2569 stop:3396 length:828 start_codon:yes stop_codon:yes gene_type:complete
MYKNFNSKHYLTTLLALIFSVCFSAQSNESSVVLEGHYQGKNLYVQNPFAGSGVGFCVIAVYINDDVTTDQVNSSAFEIDFSNTPVKKGDPVTVRIQHKNDCLPKVLNPEVLRPKSTFENLSINVDKDQTLHWKTKNEQGKLTYIVEQYRWNKWVKIGEVDGSGLDTESSYKFNVSSHLHSGQNKFRAKQVDYTGRPRPTKSTIFEDDSRSPVSLINPKIKKSLDFSENTLYEIFDTYGNLVKKGYGQSINVENLEKGLYYVNYDAKTGEVVSKK